MPKIVSQRMFPNGVLRTYEDGSQAIYPYLESDEGQYIELFPNDPETHLDPDAFRNQMPIWGVTPEGAER